MEQVFASRFQNGSAFICVICGFFRSVGGLGGLGVFAVQKWMGGWAIEN